MKFVPHHLLADRIRGSGDLMPAMDGRWPKWFITFKLVEISTFLDPSQLSEVDKYRSLRGGRDTEETLHKFR